MTEHNKRLIEELEKRLLWYREEASADEFDADEVDAICTMLLKLSPESGPRRTKEEAYQNILRQIALEEDSEGEKTETGSGKRRHFFTGKRVLRAAIVFLAAAGIFASLNMATYARENKSLFTMILERVGWLDIEKEPEAESPVAKIDNIEKILYDSWGDLDREVKERITVPAYIPEGYSLYALRCWNGKDEKVVKSDYYDQGNGHLSIDITLWEDNADHYRETVMDETIYTLLSEYSDENTFYYEYEDEYICLAFGEKSFYRISGNISLEEMRKIREGVGEIIH